jgi:hypothetical protein
VAQRLGLEFKPQYYKKKKVIIIALGFLPGEKLPVFPSELSEWESWSITQEQRLLWALSQTLGLCLHYQISSFFSFGSHC